MFDTTQGNGMIRLADLSLALASRRQTLIASNLANIDTPGYRTRDFSFHGALKAALAGPSPAEAMAATDARHLQPAPDLSLPRTDDPIFPAWERNDGNDVNLDRENMLLARTQSAYQTASLLLQHELRHLYFAIREANK